jgi:hypothetical protein
MESSIDLFSCTYPLPRPQGAGEGSDHLARGGAAVLMPKQARGATRAPPGSTRKKWSPRAISAQLVPVRVQLISTSLLALLRPQPLPGSALLYLQPLPLLFPALRSSALPREGTAVEEARHYYGPDWHCGTLLGPSAV